MTHKIFTAILISLFSISNLTFAQNEEAERKKIMTMIKEFNEDAAQLPTKGSLQADKILSYVNANLFYQTTTINILNQVNRESANKELIAHILREMRQTDIISKRNLGAFEDFSIRGNVASFTYTVDYELYESDRLINKGHQNAYAIVRKDSDGNWKIESLNVFNADDKTYKSTCICEIYETKNLQNIIVETILPDGHEADIVEDKFSIDESVEPKTVRHGFRDFYWTADGSIFRRKIDGSQGEKIGNAKSRQELLLSLIKIEAYPDRCSTVVRKLK